MRVFGNLTNRIMEASRQPEPMVGMAATILAYTDRYAGTVTMMAQGYIEVRRDRATRTDQNGMSESQAYSYETDPRGLPYIFKKNRRGVWQQCDFNPMTGNLNIIKGGGAGLLLGHRDEYHDFSF